jgi:hypothetical protein
MNTKELNLQPSKAKIAVTLPAYMADLFITSSSAQV